MSIVVKHCDEQLARYHGHVSPIILSVAALVIFGFVSPTLLYAAEVTSSVNNFSLQPEEFRPEKPRIFFGTSTPGGMLSNSSTLRQGEFEKKRELTTSTKERIILYKTARIQKLKEALTQIELQAKDLRIQLENLQTASPSSTEALNLGQLNAKINNLMMVFKKVNFNSELNSLKIELKNEFNKRQIEMKKELIKKQEIQKREAIKFEKPEVTSNSQ